MSEMEYINRNQSCWKKKTAQMIRIITVPPILVILLIVILSLTRDDVFRGTSNQIISVLLLGLVPILAYLLQPLLPKFKNMGREGQRKLAFILNMAGYAFAVIYGYVQNVKKNLKLIFLIYFLSVLILTFFNKIVRIRASGHACSATGPLLILTCFIGWRALIPCLLVGAMITWASLELNRHTKKELFMGMLTCVMAFILAQCILF